MGAQVEAEKGEREAALQRLRKEQEAERERVKRALAELKKKLDRRDFPSLGASDRLLYAAW